MRGGGALLWRLFAIRLINFNVCAGFEYRNWGFRIEVMFRRGDWCLVARGMIDLDICSCGAEICDCFFNFV